MRSPPPPQRPRLHFSIIPAVISALLLPSNPFQASSQHPVSTVSASPALSAICRTSIRPPQREQSAVIQPPTIAPPQPQPAPPSFRIQGITQPASFPQSPPQLPPEIPHPLLLHSMLRRSIRRGGGGRIGELIRKKKGGVGRLQGKKTRKKKRKGNRGCPVSENKKEEKII